MSESAKETFSRETQKQRWAKYGANVALTIAVAIVLAGVITFLAQRTHRIFDTRRGSSNALKPQSINIIRDLKNPVKLVSLYSAQGRSEDKLQKKARVERMQTVEDLLNDYKRYGKNISVDFIDPDASPAKVDGLIQQITTQYGGEVAKYKEFLSGYEAKRQEVKKLADDESTAVAKLPLDQITEKDKDLKITLVTIVYSVQDFGESLDRQKESIDRLLKQEPPDYKGATDRVRTAMDDFSQNVATIIERLGTTKDNPATPDAFKKYAEESSPRYQAMKKLADDVVKQIDGLGDLKLDSLRQSLKQRDSILVMGPSDLRVIPFERVWKPDTQNQMKAYLSGNEEAPPAFAGEQAITTTIVSLTRATKPKIVFIRTGGAPLTTPGMPPFQRGGPLSDIADRLRDYNFEVLEKDLSGMWAMQSMQQGMPSPPEPKDEEIADAVWVMLPLAQRQQQMPTPSEMGPKLAEHLKAGGPAMVLIFPQSDDLASVTKEYGIEGNAKALIVHEPIETGRGAQGDQLDEAVKLPFVFNIKNYGDHDITRSLRSLRSLLVPLMPVKAVDAKDCKVVSLIPVPEDPKSWAETDIEGAFDRKPVKFEPEKGDSPSPVYAMATSEKKDGARLAVIGAGAFAANPYLEEPDPEIAQARRKLVARFPANGDLFMNTVYWLSKQDTMIAISPAAMEVPRIADMSDGTLAFWRVGVMLIGLPGLVIAAGIGVYFSRRD